MGAPRKADWREERRKRAWNLKEQGWQQKDIAVAWGVSEGAVCQWLKRGREQGVEALTAHLPTGVTPRLTAEQKAQIPELLAKGAEVYRFRGDVWTARRVAEVIDRIFGVHYHPDHVGRLLREGAGDDNSPSSGRRSADLPFKDLTDEQATQIFQVTVRFMLSLSFSICFQLL